MSLLLLFAGAGTQGPTIDPDPMVVRVQADGRVVTIDAMGRSVRVTTEGRIVTVGAKPWP